ncbi:MULTISPECIES: DNA cytosine methyltransferase [Streptomyces]|uniref:DNA (cytosine-5-)-methyltransferase n=1 Tax=Streptomyces doudnae TaxID=3075536 RepID=A0ABD5EML7_9ACTN|nr:MULTISPECIES: DNA cytosine methyltransferase [unclassified Streptomyces]MDT0435881.1 DNA cytosine methyltransferase [Streptomyces sp. DSM 41981]MYQ63928.1 DNA cytosine methyltransferase [Streptomyces sp. SID4950]SCD68354.1 DNA (cytosine-5)-methyltransferase 1 [Streptomyces sp. SolWspMP-5a-2]
MAERLGFVDVCAGAGGLASGLERAGFSPVLLLDNKEQACETLRTNRPRWKVLCEDLIDFLPEDHPESLDVDLLSAGLPRVKASAAVGRADSEPELRLLTATVYLVHAIRPRALLLENLPALLDSPAYAEIRGFIEAELSHLGYRFRWFVLNAADFGVPQERMQGVLVALQEPWFDAFVPPAPTVGEHVSVGRALHRSMGARGWPEADVWASQARAVAPTLVGGSDNRGGADLGPTGTKRAWARMGVNGGALADQVPGPDYHWPRSDDMAHMLKITVDQAAELQSFPPDWRITGQKTARYRQIGHATPPPVGTALGVALATALRSPVRA